MDGVTREESKKKFMNHCCSNLMSREYLSEFQVIRDQLDSVVNIFLVSPTVENLQILKDQLDSPPVISCINFLKSQLSPVPFLMEEAKKSVEVGQFLNLQNRLIAFL